MWSADTQSMRARTAGLTAQARARSCGRRKKMLMRFVKACSGGRTDLASIQQAARKEIRRRRARAYLLWAGGRRRAVAEKQCSGTSTTMRPSLYTGCWDVAASAGGGWPPARRPAQTTTPETATVIASTHQHWAGSKETPQREAPAFLWCVCAEILNDLNHAVSWVLMGTHPWGLFRQVQTFAIQIHLSLQQLRVFRHKKVRSNRVHVGSRMITHIAYAVGEFTSAYLELRFFLDAIVQRRRRLGQSSPTCTQLDCGFRTHHHLCYHSLAFRNSHNPTF